MLASDDGEWERWLDGCIEGCEEAFLDGLEDMIGVTEGSLLASGVGFDDALGWIEN